MTCDHIELLVVNTTSNNISYTEFTNKRYYIQYREHLCHGWEWYSQNRSSAGYILYM